MTSTARRAVGTEASFSFHLRGEGGGVNPYVQSSLWSEQPSWKAQLSHWSCQLFFIKIVFFLSENYHYGLSCIKVFCWNLFVHCQNKYITWLMSTIWPVQNSEAWWLWLQLSNEGELIFTLVPSNWRPRSKLYTQLTGSQITNSVFSLFIKVPLLCLPLASIFLFIGGWASLKIS